MTREEFEAIKRRCEAATKGPWYEDKTEPRLICAAGNWWPVKITGDSKDNPKSDLDFVVHARTDVPALVEEVEKLRGLMKRLISIADRSVGPVNFGETDEWASRGYNFVDKEIREALGEE